MLYEGKIWLGTGEHPVCLLPQMANRHGLIAGATGTGKTVSLKVLAEGFSDMGVPVFLADIKGDLAGMVQPGTHSDNIANRLTQCGVPTFEYRTFPTVFWDVFGKEGHPVRTTVSEMGPLLLSRMMDLTDAQEGVLNIAFRVAENHTVWSFTLVPEGGQTTVVERREAAGGKTTAVSSTLIAALLGGNDDFERGLLVGMKQTLSHIKSEAEAK